MNTFEIRLDLDKSTRVQVVTIRQGDVDGTTVSATVYDHGALADLSGISSAYIEFALPDGTHYYRGGATVSGSVVTALVDESQAASVPGRACNAYFSLVDATTGKEYSTSSFVVAVLASAVDGMELAESWDNEIQAAIQACWNAAQGVTVADGAITASKLANDSVTTPKLANGSVTLAKLASDVQIPQPTDAQVTSAVNAALTAHPEWTTTVQDGSIDYTKLADSLKNDFNIYCGLNFGESLEIVANEYVDGGGRIASDSHFSRTRAFKVFKNMPLTVKATGYSTGVSMIATCTESENNVISRVRSIDSSEHVYSYTPTEDGYAIVSYNHAYPHEIVFGTDASGAYLKNEVLALSEQMGYPDDTFPLFEGAHYIDRNGTKQSQSSFNIYGFVTIDAGDSVSATVRGAGTSVAVIFSSNSNHDLFTPLVMCTDSTTRTYTYTATSKMTIGLCSHIDAPPTYSVTRVPLFERVSDASVENSALNPILAFGAITCIGDSLTWSQVYTGNSTSRQAYNPYPKVIEHLTGVPTSYIARPGASPASLWSDSEGDIIAKDGQLTIIYLGTNNGLTDTIETDMVGDDYTTWASTETGCYGKFIAKSLSVNSRVVLVKVHSSSGNVDTTNTVIEKMGQRFGIPVLTNEYLGGAIYHNWPNGQGSNGTHYNDFGYAQFAKNIVGKVNNISVDDLLNMIPV